MRYIYMYLVLVSLSCCRQPSNITQTVPYSNTITHYIETVEFSNIGEMQQITKESNIQLMDIDWKERIARISFPPDDTIWIAREGEVFSHNGQKMSSIWLYSMTESCIKIQIRRMVMEYIEQRDMEEWIKNMRDYAPSNLREEEENDLKH